MQKPKIECIYLDMDGVIADFEKRYKELYGIHPREAENKQKFNAYFDDFIANNNFATLDLMPDAMELINALRKANVPTQILSSTANQERYDEISKQKQVWLQTHGITFPQNFVPGKRHKKNWASPNRIIIDDTKSIIDDWKEAGGIAIWHQDVPSTLLILSMYI
jgi:hypothetical protein